MAGECNAADGNNMDTPSEINVVDFVQCRALELDEMMKSVSEPVAGSRLRITQQQVPRHMRRRAANHDVRRLPLKRRLAAQSDAADGTKLRKRPSRRHRRRPKNLLAEYARRKRQNIWLETHIWHAKRFHMTTMWGYKIPNYPNDRGVRAAYRDAATRCAMMDLSYYCCIEVTGQQQHLVDSLARITSPETGPTFGAVCYINGTRQGQTVLYCENSYPFHALGDVTFLWRPLSASSKHDGTGTWTRQLWIWTHPACYGDIFTALKKVFHLTEADCRSVPVCSSHDGRHSDEESVKFETRKRKKKKKRKDDAGCPKRPKLNDVTAASEDAVVCQDTVVTQRKTVEKSTKLSTETKTPSLATSFPDTNIESEAFVAKDSCSVNSKNTVQGGDAHVLSKTGLVRIVYENSSVRLESLKDELCRFRLIGPKSHHVIVEAVRLAEATSDRTSDHVTDNTETGQLFSCEVKKRWWDDYVISVQGLSEAVQQASSWKKVSAVHDSAELPPFSVHGLTVRDPRLFLPQRQTSVSNSMCDREYAVVNSVDALASSSPIWDRAVRDDVRQTMMSTAELNRHRSKCLLPGSVPDLGQKESRIPVLLIQNPGFQRSLQHQPGGGSALDFGAGWDVILPAGWSMAFWIAFIYRGGKAVGLREHRSLAFEAGELTFPDRCPDTPSGAEMSSSRAAELRSAYNRRPPAKRCNYDKMGVTAPFHCPWLELAQAWMHNSVDGQTEQSFYCVRNRKLLRLLNDVCAGVSSRSKSGGQNSFDESAADGISTALQQCGPAIVQVHLVMLGRGAPSQLALICLPTKEDVLDASCRKKLGRGSAEGPTEPLHNRTFADTRASGLKLPLGVLGSTVRQTIGFIVEGGFSHATAKGSGVGFVSALGLKKLLEEKPDRACNTTVLVRCTYSLQYRPAVLHVVI